MYIKRLTKDLPLELRPKRASRTIDSDHVQAVATASEAACGPSVSPPVQIIRSTTLKTLTAQLPPRRGGLTTKEDTGYPVLQVGSN